MRRALLLPFLVLSLVYAPVSQAGRLARDLTRVATPTPAAAESAALLNVAVSMSQSVRTVGPGWTDVLLATVAIDNGYTVLGGPRFVETLRLTNTTAGPGS